jgi:hypothetical protein
MANDVFEDVASRNPAPNIDETIQYSEVTMDEDNLHGNKEDNEDMEVIEESNGAYVKLSTTTVGNNQQSNNQPPHTTIAPEDPFTSGFKPSATWTQEITSPKTPPTSNTSTYNTSLDSISPKTDTTLENTTRSNNPIKPLSIPTSSLQLLTSGTPTNTMNSLGGPINQEKMNSATRIAVRTSTTEVDRNRERSADHESKSFIDTGDVSKQPPTLKPKTIFNPFNITNPYAKKTSDKTKTTLLTTTLETAPPPSYTATQSVNKLTNSPSTNDILKNDEQINYVDLTQEEIDLINKEITKQNQQEQWTQVDKKHSAKLLETSTIDITKIDNNPFSVLQDEDHIPEKLKDNETKVTETINSKSNHQSNVPTDLVQAHENTTKTTQSKPKSPPRHTTSGRGPNPHNTRRSGRGGGGPKSPPRPIHTNNPGPESGQDTTTAMEIDTPQDTNNSTNASTDSRYPPNRRSNNLTLKFTFRIHIKAYPPNDEQDEKVPFTRLYVIHNILQAFKAKDPTSSIIMPQDSQNPQRTYNNINVKSKNVSEYKKIEELLNINDAGIIHGNITITSNTRYSTIRKNQDTKDLLQEVYKLNIIRNDINMKNPTEVGFFVHYAVRHDTVECTKFLKANLPEDIPPYQQELTTLWAGANNQRKGVGVLKIFAESENVSTLAHILSTTFNDPNETNFIPKEYFNTLEPTNKTRFIKTQYDYQRKHGTLLVRGIKSIDLPTKITENNIQLSIHEWLLTIPDLQQCPLFNKIKEVNENEIEVQFLVNNLTLAQKWTRNAIVHISRVLYPIQVTSAFTEQALNNLANDDVEEWNPPPPPTVEFIQKPNAWGKPPKTSSDEKTNKKDQRPTARKTQRMIKDNTNLTQPKHKTSIIEFDNQTVTTVNTQTSYTQDTISELQNTSQQHHHLLTEQTRRIDHLNTELQNNTQQHHQLLEEHARRFEQIDLNVQTQLENVHRNHSTLEAEQQQLRQQQELFSQELETATARTAQATTSIENQQQQLLQHLSQQKKFNRQVRNELRSLRETQSSHQTMIATLQEMVLSMRNSGPSTPLSQTRTRKKQRPRTPDLNTTQEDSQEDTEGEELQQMNSLTREINFSMDLANPPIDFELHDDQMETNNNNSIDSTLTSLMNDDSHEEVSFINNDNDDETLVTSLLAWNGSNSEEDRSTDEIQTQAPTNRARTPYNADLGGYRPGQGT